MWVWGMETLPLELTLAIALGIAIVLLIITILRYEADLPVIVSAMIVPFVVVAGFGAAFVLHRQFQLSLIESLGVLGVALFGLTALYELNYSPVVRL